MLGKEYRKRGKGRELERIEGLEKIINNINHNIIYKGVLPYIGNTCVTYPSPQNIPCPQGITKEKQTFKLKAFNKN